MAGVSGPLGAPVVGTALPVVSRDHRTRRPVCCVHDAFPASVLPLSLGERTRPAGGASLPPQAYPCCRHLQDSWQRDVTAAAACAPPWLEKELLSSLTLGTDVCFSCPPKVAPSEALMP